MLNTKRNFSRYALVAALAVSGVASMAQSYDAVRLQAAAPGKDGGYVGAGVIAGTQYLGSDERRTAYLPTVEYQWASGWFAGASNGIGYNFSKNPALQYGARLTVDIGREENRSSALKGMGDVAAKAEAGGFLNYAIVPGWMLSSSLRTGSGTDGKGTLLDLGLSYSTKVNDQWRLSTGVGATWANDAYMQSYFGVSATQSIASGYASYAPGAALRDVRFRAAVAYQINPSLIATTSVAYTQLSDDAKRSPIVRQQNSTTAVLAVAYAF